MKRKIGCCPARTNSLFQLNVNTVWQLCKCEKWAGGFEGWWHPTVNSAGQMIQALFRFLVVLQYKQGGVRLVQKSLSAEAKWAQATSRGELQVLSTTRRTGAAPCWTKGLNNMESVWWTTDGDLIHRRTMKSLPRRCLVETIWQVRES